MTEEGCKVILLLRSQTVEENDQYHKVLKEEGFQVFSIPLIDFCFINLDTINTKLINHKDYQAVVFTSQQAVRATQEVIKEWTDSEKSALVTSLKCYVVGKATYRAAKQLGFLPQGEETGNANNLCSFILSDLSKTDTRPFLFPCSNIRKDTVVERLSSEGCAIDEIKVYKTVSSQGVKEKVQELVGRYTFPAAVVFFSPSGVQSYLENGLTDIIDKDTKKVSIGPTTTAELEKTGIEVFGTAQKPDPQSLLDVLKLL